MIQTLFDTTAIQDGALQEPIIAYAILNPLSEPNPLLTWIEQEWAGEFLPLYIQTPLESVLKASPWLLQLNPRKASEIQEWLIAQAPDSSWGWLYTSKQDWQAQRQHWQQYLRIVIDDDLKAVRFQDPRVVGIWLPHHNVDLWQGLLAPVIDIRLPNHALYHRPCDQQLINEQFPWVLPEVLSEAWHHSDIGIQAKVFNLHTDLWEQSPEQAEAWEAQGIALAERLRGWLVQRIEQGLGVKEVKVTAALAWLASTNNAAERNSVS
jgi:hypothetical protein